ncbi:MAG: hypothetical protein ABR570_15445 [Burkholderiales bacterium]
MSEDRAAQIAFLREAIEHLDDKSKGDLKVALYGSAFLITVSLLPYGELAHASLLVSAIDLWYFMSWGNDQLRLIQHRDELKALEGADGLEAREEAHPNFLLERALYYGTSSMVFALFIAALGLDWHVIEDRFWRAAYFVLVASCFVVIAGTFLSGLARDKERVRRRSPGASSAGA